MVGPGWALNPELAGMTASDRHEPHRTPAAAYLRRDAGLSRLLIGGRYLDGVGTSAVRATVTLDDQPLAEWVEDGRAGWFVRWIDLPDASAGDGPYATLRVDVAASDPARPVPENGLALLEQFDAAPAGVLMYAFNRDWHEREADPATGRQWRWSSAASTLEVRDWGGDLTLALAGASPLHDFAEAPTIRVLAGDRELARFSPTGDFTEIVAVPAEALAEAGGRIRIATNRTFVPADRDESGDRRQLGVRFFRVELTRR
jgi:hypothetical protein